MRFPHFLPPFWKLEREKGFGLDVAGMDVQVHRVWSLEKGLADQIVSLHWHIVVVCGLLPPSSLLFSRKSLCSVSGCVRCPSNSFYFVYNMSVLLCSIHATERAVEEIALHTWLLMLSCCISVFTEESSKPGRSSENLSGFGSKVAMKFNSM